MARKTGTPSAKTGTAGKTGAAAGRTGATSAKTGTPARERRRLLPAVTPLDLALQFSSFAEAAAHRKVVTRARAQRWIAAALALPGELTVRIVGTEEGRALNRQYRGKDYATNVLTFDYSRAPMVAADLVLCGPVVEREAQEQGKTLEAHYAHLLVHGALHAQGYDHELDETEALEMEALEVLLMGMLGYGDPY